jgi:hypothetical protein
MSKKIGLSLSKCVTDIHYGIVDIKDVICIVAGIHAETFNDYLEVIEIYSYDKWIRFKNHAESLAIKLWQDGKVYQPRLNGELHTATRSKFHWIDPVLMNQNSDEFTHLNIDYINSVVKKYRKAKIDEIIK